MDDNESRSGFYPPEALRREQPSIPKPEALPKRGSRPKSRIQRQREISRRDFLALSLLTAGAVILAEQGMRKILPEGAEPSQPSSGHQ